MAKISSQYVVEILCNNLQASDSSAWISISELIPIAVGKINPRLSIEERLEYAEEIQVFVSEQLRNRLSEAHDDGHTIGLEISDDGYVRSRDPVLGKVAEELRSLTPTQFELFCGRILTELGGESDVSGKSGDGGIDFTCKGLDLWNPRFPAPAALRFVIIGQAKRYLTSFINTTQLREFVGAATLRHHEMIMAGALSARQPVIFAFWTTAPFEPSAKVFARKLGIWILDGITLANYARSLNIDVLSLAIQ